VHCPKKDNCPCIVLDGVREEGYEECDCGESGQCTPLQLGYENCTTLLGPRYGGTLGCNDRGKFDTSSCQETGGDNFCITNDTKFYYVESPSCTGSGCHVKFCADVNKMGQSDLIKQRACQECSKRWNGPLDPIATSQSCQWIGGSCSLVKVFSGGLECRQDWISEGTCNPGETTRQVFVNYTKMRGEGNCSSGEWLTVSCSTAVQLPFFSKTGAAISAIIIVLVYFVYVKLKK
jgi:hypothetical protein